MPKKGLTVHHGYAIIKVQSASLNQMGGEPMATDMKRITFSIDKELEKMLNKEKKRRFYTNTQSEMIRTLIAEALAASK